MQGNGVAAQRERFNLWVWLMRVIGKARRILICDNTPGWEGGPPNNVADSGRVLDERCSSETERCSYAMRFTNDAFEVSLSRKDEWLEHGEWRYDDKWIFMMRTELFRRFAIWYLWRWVWGEWFGVRRWLFYKWLHWHVNRWKFAGKR